MEQQQQQQQQEHQQSGENAILYHLEFHFYEGDLREPTPSEIEALVCQSKDFIKEELEAEIADACIQAADITRISWTYNETCAIAPTTVTYAAEATFCDGSPVPPAELYEALKLDQDEIKLYLEEFIWKSEPLEENVFYGVNAFSFEGKIGTVIRPGEIESVNC